METKSLTIPDTAPATINDKGSPALSARAFDRLEQARQATTPSLTLREVGVVTTVSNGIAKVNGLPGAGYEELLLFPGGLLGIAFNIDEQEIGVILLGDYTHLHAGDEVLRTGRVLMLPLMNR